MRADQNSFQSPEILSQPFSTHAEDLHSTSLSASTLGDMQRLNQSGDLTQGVVPSARISENEVYFGSAPVKDSVPAKDSAPVKDVVPAKDSSETREQRLDQRVKGSFGADVFEHLKDWNWLIENRKKLEDGFKKLDGQDAYDVARRMRELSMVDGKPLIYLEKLDGPTRGDLIPKRYDVKLLRGRFRSDDYIGQVYH